MRQQMLDENHLPAIFDFHNQPIRITLYVEDRVRLNEISMGIDSPNVHQALPFSIPRDLVPFTYRPFQCVIPLDRFTPGAFANDMHSLDASQHAKFAFNSQFANLSMFWADNVRPGENYELDHNHITTDFANCEVIPVTMGYHSAIGL